MPVTEPEHQGDERMALVGFLQRQRDLVAWKLRDASDDVLRPVSTPSGLTLGHIHLLRENADGSVGEQPEAA